MSGELPYGAKKKIADSMTENPANVQTAFRGVAGERLTKKVYTRAAKYFNSEQIEKFQKQLANNL